MTAEDNKDIVDNGLDIRTPSGTDDPLSDAEIQQYREEINRMDRIILDAAKRRTEVSQAIGRTRMNSGGTRLVHTREIAILNQFRDELGEEGPTIASALLRRPPLLILDEPTNGLDPRGIGEIRDLLIELNRTGTTVVLSSHLLAEVETLCTRVGVLDAGSLVLTEDVETLRAPTGRILVHTPDPDGAARLLGRAVEDRSGPALRVRASDPAGLNAHLVGHGVPVTGLEVERRSLEQVVLELTGTSADRFDGGPVRR